MTTVTIAQFKSHLSEFIGRVTLKQETLLVTRHGRAVARILPPETTSRRFRHVEEGGLENENPFFLHLSDIVKSRTRHKPRVFK